MKPGILLTCALVACLAPVAGAADVIVTDCTVPPVVASSRTTGIDVRPNNLILACQLEPLPGTSRIRIRANRITVMGPAGGVSAPGKGKAIDLQANESIVVKAATLEASNGNGTMRLRSRTGFDIQNAVLTTGEGDRAGRQMILDCTGTLCPATILRSNFLGHVIKLKVKGTITGIDNTLVTRGPRDQIDVKSLAGDALLCCDTFDGHNEGNVAINAFCQVNLTQSEVTTGEYITVNSGLGGALCQTPTNTLLVDATLDNDFGKLGEIAVTARGGQSQIDISGATLVDDDVRKPGDVSKLNGREEIPHTGFNNVVGVPATDS